MMSNNNVNRQNIIPPYLLRCIAQDCDVNDKACVLNTLDHVNKLMKKSIEEKILVAENTKKDWTEE